MEGYIYCISNKSMSGILKIGRTRRDPSERLKEANKHDTWKPPTPYKIEFAKKVLNHVEKEIGIHKILAERRVDPAFEFFYASVEQVKRIFDVIDGIMWESNDENNNDLNNSSNNDLDDDLNDNDSDDNEYIENFKNINISNISNISNNISNNTNHKDSNKNTKRCRKEKICFQNGQLIRHIINDNVWIGTYNLSNNTITCNGTVYGRESPLHHFVKGHHQYMNGGEVVRIAGLCAWNDCEYKVGQVWYSTCDL